MIPKPTAEGKLIPTQLFLVTINGRVSYLNSDHGFVVNRIEFFSSHYLYHKSCSQRKHASAIGREGTASGLHGSQSVHSEPKPHD